MQMIWKEDGWKTIVWWICVVTAIGLCGYAAYITNWDLAKTAVALRLKFPQIINLILLWGPVILFDLATKGRTIEALNTPVMPLERVATAIFYGLMGIATSLVVIWGN